MFNYYQSSLTSSTFINFHFSAQSQTILERFPEVVNATYGETIQLKFIQKALEISYPFSLSINHGLEVSGFHTSSLYHF